MKALKKITGFILAFVLLATSCFCNMSLESEAAVITDSSYKLNFTPQNMITPTHRDDFPFAQANNNYNMNNYTSVVVSEGYTNIIAYEAPADGMIKIDPIVSFKVRNGASVEFGVVDADGNILTNGGTMFEVSYENSFPQESVAERSISKGERIYFLLHGISGDIFTITLRAAVLFKEIGGSYARVDNDGVLWASKSNTTQGAGNFYYQYATDYQKVFTGGVDMGSVMEKKLQFTKQAMTYDSSSSTFKGTAGGAWSNYQQFVGSPGQSNIFTVKMPENGTFRVSAMTLTLFSQAGRSMDFCITDENGNILYPTDGSVLTLNETQASQASIAVTKEDMRAGEEIHFVFFNLQDASNAQFGWSLIGNIFCNDNHLNFVSSNHFWPVANSDSSTITGNGHNNFWYYYSNDVQTVDKHREAWKSFADLGTFDEIPNTIEVAVNVPQSIEYEKRGIIFSNADGSDKGLSLEMFYNGRLRLHSADQTIDFVVDTDIRTGEWTRLAFVNDTKNDQILCFIDGVLAATYNGSYSAENITNGNRFLLGNDNILDDTLAFQGRMQSISLWSDVRTQEELQQSLTSTLTGTEEGLVDAWQLTAYDSNNNYFPNVTGTKNALVFSPYDRWIETSAPVQYDYTMAVIGDTQYYAESTSNIKNFETITEYLNNNVETLDLKFVSQMGDLSANNSDTEYERTKAVMNKLTDVPYAVVLGNHDYPSFGTTVRDSTNFNTYFTEDTYRDMSDLTDVGFYAEYFEVAAKDTYVSKSYTVVEDDAADFESTSQVRIGDVVTRTCENQDIAVGDTVALKVDNYYQKFTVGDVEYLMLNLEFRARDAVLSWADDVAEANPNSRIIVNTHELTTYAQLSTGEAEKYFTTTAGETESYNNGSQIWENFAKKHENITMMFCGHEHSPYASGRVMVGDNGNTVYQYMIAPTMGNGGDGVFLLMYFNESKQTVDFRYYSPVTGKYWCKENQFQITLGAAENTTNNGASNITEKVKNLDAQFSNGNFVLYNFDNSSNAWYGVYMNRDASFCNKNYSIIRQYEAQKAGSGEFVVSLKSMVKGLGDNVTAERYIDFKIYDTNGVNVTAKFSSGDTISDAYSGQTSSTNLTLYNAGGDDYYRLYGTFNGGYLYGKFDNVSAGDDFYFVSQTAGTASGSVSLQDKIYVKGDIVSSDSTLRTIDELGDASANWAYSVDNCPNGTNTAYGTQGYAGWYYRYAKTSDLTYSNVYSIKENSVDVTIQGKGSVATIQDNVSYEGGIISLPHHNSLYLDVTPETGYRLSAIFYNGEHLNSNLTTTRYLIPCVEADGELRVVFEPESVSVSVNTNQYMQPYWEGTTVYNESVWVVEKSDGTIADIPLMYQIDSVISVYSSDLKTKYVKDVDYSIVDGKLHILENSKIPVTTYAEYYPSEASDNTFANWGNTGYLYFSEGAEIHKKQIAVTYTHSDEWNGYVPTTRINQLVKTYGKLNNNENLSIGFYGDSITTGANATGVVNAEPYMSSWMELFRQGLVREYGYADADAITTANYAVGGWTVENGVENMKTQIQSTEHDLMIIAFGMNDGIEPSVFKEKTQAIITYLNAQNADMEILLVSTSLPNSESASWNKNRLGYEEALLDLTKEGIAVSRMTSVHSYLLECKNFRDMTGNNINHPNDFLARAYAQTMLASLSKQDSDKVPIIGNVTEDSQRNILDLVRLKKYLSDTTVTIRSKQAADVQESNSINEKDISALRKLFVDDVSLAE